MGAYSQLLINMILLEVLFPWGTISFFTTLRVSFNQQYWRLPMLHNTYVPWERGISGLLD